MVAAHRVGASFIHQVFARNLLRTHRAQFHQAGTRNDVSSSGRDAQNDFCRKDLTESWSEPGEANVLKPSVLLRNDSTQNWRTRMGEWRLPPLLSISRPVSVSVRSAHHCVFGLSFGARSVRHYTPDRVTGKVTFFKQPPPAVARLMGAPLS